MLTPATLHDSESLLRPSADSSKEALTAAAEVAAAFLENTGQTAKNNAFSVLYALAKQTAERAPDGRPTRFSAINLKAAVAPAAVKDPSGWMSPLWSKLIELEPQWQEGLVDTARTLQLGFVPKLVKENGSPASYFLEAVPVSTESPSGPVAAVPEGGVRYTPEAVGAPAAWLSNALGAGVVRWTSSLRWTIAALLVSMMLTVLAALWLSLYIGAQTTRPLSVGDVTSLLLLAGALAALYQPYRFVDELFTMRIAMAPDALTSLTNHNVTLEVRKAHAKDEVGELAFVRYSAICTKCGGTVDVDRGRQAFPDRLIGRCRRSGSEHVYSFDHVLRIGAPLR